VLSGVFEEDKDVGNNFLYSGCGGTGSNSSETVPQALDHELTRHN